MIIINLLFYPPSEKVGISQIRYPRNFRLDRIWRMILKLGDGQFGSSRLQCSLRNAREREREKEREKVENKTLMLQWPRHFVVASLHDFATLQPLCMASCYTTLPRRSSLRLHLGWGYHSLRLLHKWALFPCTRHITASYTSRGTKRKNKSLGALEEIIQRETHCSMHFFPISVNFSYNLGTSRRLNIRLPRL